MAYGFTYTLPTITGSHTDFPVLLREDDFPSAAIDGGSSSILNGGGNLRAYTSSAKTTRLPVDVVSFVAGGTPAAEVWVKIPTAATSNTIYIEADATETTQPAVTNTYGRNAVWSDYEAVYHLDETANTDAGGYLDSTGNGNDGTGNSASITQETGQIGSAAGGTGGSGVYITCPTKAVSTIKRLSSWMSFDTLLVNQTFGSHDGTNRLYLGIDASDRIFAGYGNSYTQSVSSGFSSATPYKVSLAVDGGTVRVRVDGVEKTTFSASASGASAYDLLILARNRATIDNEIDGWQDEVLLDTVYRSADWEATEYANQSASGAWGTVGTWADSGGGVSASIGLVTETSAAFSMAAAKSMAVGLAGETDSALPLTAGHVVTSGQAASAESAFSLSWSKLLAIGLAAESDSALSMSYSASTVVQIGISSEADSAFQMERVKTLAIGQSDETDTALSVAAQKSLSIGLSGESGSALAVSIAKTLSLDIAVEADAALAFAYPQTIAIGVSQETDQALSFSALLAGGVIAAARATRHTYTSRPSHTASSRPAAISRSRRH